MSASRNSLFKLINTHTHHKLSRNLLRRLSTTNNEIAEQNPPEPIPNRPLRAPKHQKTPKDDFQNEPQKGTKLVSNESTSNFTKVVSDGFENDASFLEKFKLNSQKNKKVVSSSGGERVEDGEGGDGSPRDADEIFKKMKETGLIPNAVAMLDGLCKDGLVQEAMKLFGLMREKGTIPEVVVYTAVVDGFCKGRKVEDAKRVFRKMQGNGVVPNAFSYGVLVQGLCKCGAFDEGVEFTLEMLDSGHSPNVATFVGLIDGVCREKGVEGAKDVILRLVKKGFFLNEKAVKEFLEKKKPFSPPLWEAIFGKKTRENVF